MFVCMKIIQRPFLESYKKIVFFIPRDSSK